MLPTGRKLVTIVVTLAIVSIAVFAVYTLANPKPRIFPMTVISGQSSETVVWNTSSRPMVTPFVNSTTFFSLKTINGSIAPSSNSSLKLQVRLLNYKLNLPYGSNTYINDGNGQMIVSGIIRPPFHPQFVVVNMAYEVPPGSVEVSYGMSYDPVYYAAMDNNTSILQNITNPIYRPMAFHLDDFTSNESAPFFFDVVVSFTFSYTILNIPFPYTFLFAAKLMGQGMDPVSVGASIVDNNVP